MTTISAKIIADSVSLDKIRLTTMQLRYPRFIHAEFMTHRVFSRNASSSRAVPVKRTIEWVQKDTAMPRHWGKNQKGMQAEEECSEKVCIYRGVHSDDYKSREEAWNDARDNATRSAHEFHRAGYHKQIVNRLLEPFAHINVVVSSTKWANFFKLRDHKDAMPEIQELAREMKTAMTASKPQFLRPGEWHLPYITVEDRIELSGNTMFMQAWETDFNGLLTMASVARCARVSYLTTEGKKPNVEDDLALYERLMGDPLHASPAEHQATPDRKTWGSMDMWDYQREHGNFYGWRQFRKMHPNEEAVDELYNA